MHLLKMLYQRLPAAMRHEVRRWRYRFIILRQKFVSPELEYQQLEGVIQGGEMVIDIGANVGHYTLLFSRLAGKKGRVVAFEPILATFDLLVSNVVAAKCGNVSLMNVAVTDRADELGFTIPNGNFYQSHQSLDGDNPVLGYPLERFELEAKKPGFIKIDAEGCDESIIVNSKAYILRHRPIVMAEIPFSRLKILAGDLPDYQVAAIAGSHNAFLVPVEKKSRFSGAIFTFS